MIRSRALRLFMLVVGAFCVAAGALMAVGGEGLGGLVVVLPFGLLCLLFGLVRPPAKGSREGLSVQTLAVDGLAEQAAVFALSRRRLWIAIAGCGLFALVGLGIALDGSPVLGALCGGVFLAGAVMGLLGVRRATHVALTPTRVVLPTARFAWNDVEEVTRVSINSAEMVGFQLRKGAPLAGRAPLRRLNRALGAEQAVAYNVVRADPELLQDLAERLHAAGQADERSALISRLS